MKREKKIETVELFRVTYDDGYFERLMMQTDSDGSPPFYCVYKDKYDLCPVETMSHDLGEILAHLKKCYNADLEAGRSSAIKNNSKVAEIHAYVLSKEMDFIKQVKSLIS